jgi:hypothetical protein
MTRRALILGSCSSLLATDSAKQVYDLLADMAAALSGANPQWFMADIEKSMPGYQKLSIDVAALLREYLAESSVELRKNEGNDRIRTVEADWLLTLRPVDAGTFSKPEAMATVRREEILKCTAARQGRKWKITALQPADFFSPPAA